MRLPVPGPRELISVLERGAGSIEQLLAAAPRLTALIGDAEQLLVRTAQLVDGIESTRRNADAVVDRTEAVVTRADSLVAQMAPLEERLSKLLDGLEPPLTRLQPVLERLAETTDPREVDALVQLVDQLPRLADRMETEIIPILDSMSTVSPDLRDLLDVSRELNQMLAQVPGISRMKRRIDKEQAEAAEAGRGPDVP